MRLLTRSDFDGLACGALLMHLGIIDEFKFVHPKDIQDGLVQAGPGDILANVPFIQGCKLWFDHHYSETERPGKGVHFEGVSVKAPSCARVIYDYYGGDKTLGRFKEMIGFVDRVDSAALTVDEITNPGGWILLGFIMDPRTGLGRFHDFTVGNYELMTILAKSCVDKNIDEILAMSDVKERIQKYHEQNDLFKKMLVEVCAVQKNVIVADLRNTSVIYAGNRFLLYTLFPEQNISVWIVAGRDNRNVVITVGYSVINRTAAVNVGSLMLHYGGGGHVQVGTCQVSSADADRVIAEIIEKVKAA
ncbi:MAG: exopolyphosphatase [Treponema sp.]|jgi:nanoRNase/pAp phosphatase (c-di-AMP/oligoRNAs hydrolase)|nr:exopolyphosphatase [Treponema sp.]